MDVSYLPKFPKYCFPRLESCTLLMMNLCLFIYMELYLVLGALIPMIKWYVVQWNYIMIMSQRIPVPNSYYLSKIYFQ